MNDNIFPRLICLAAVVLGQLSSGCVIRNRVSVEDEGVVCPAPEGHTGYLNDPMTFEVGDAVILTVIHDACLSSTCDVDRHMICDVTLDGTQLLVHSRGSFVEREGYVVCTDDCGFLQAECLTPPLPAGDYVIVHGDSERPLTIPSTITAPCDYFF